MDPVPTRILLVEDNPGDVLLLQEALREKEENPYRVERAERLRDGLERLSKGGLDLVLLDLFLPDSSGFSTLKSVLEVAPQIPVVVLTGLNDRETAMKSLHEGAQDFLVKGEWDASLLARSISYSIERHHLLQKAKEDEERYFLVALGSHDGLWDWDLQTGQVYFSPRWKLMLGFSEGEIGNDPGEWLGRVHPGDLERVKRGLHEHLAGKTSHYANEHRLKHKDGRYRWVLSRGLATSDRNGRATRIAGSFTDITRHKNMEQQLALRAFYDPLTGLPNRAFFMESLSRTCARLKRNPSFFFALFFLDLDRLKFVNDRMGHQAGDHLLVEFARRLRACVRPQDLVARMGGDEFTVLLENLGTPAEAIEVADRILESVEETIPFGRTSLSTTVSIGIVFSDSGQEGPDAFLKAADTAMYQAKTTGKARYVVFGRENDQRSTGENDGS